MRMARRLHVFWIGDNNSWDDGGDSGDYADFDSTNNTDVLCDDINAVLLMI